MNPTIELLCAAFAVGLVSGAIRALWWRPVVRETGRALPDYDMSWLQGLPSVRPERDENALSPATEEVPA